MLSPARSVPHDQDARTQSRLRQLALLATLVFALAAVGLPSRASAAYVWPSHASYTHNYHYSYSELRSGPNRSWSYVTANLYNNTTVYMRCYVDSQWWNAPNYGSSRWFYVNVWTGTRWIGGWIHSSYVWNQASVPYGC